MVNKMECNLYKETSTSKVYAVNRSFYLVIPKLRIDPSIEVIIDSEIKEKLDNYFNMSNIGIIRIFAGNYFDDLSDEISRYKLKSIINTDISISRQILNANNINYKDDILITTPFEKFKEWFVNENTRQDIFKRIKENVANTDKEILNKQDDLSQSQKRINELLELKKSILNSNNQSVGNKKSNEKVKSLSNGHSLLDIKYNDGFTNILFLSLITIIISLTWIILMFSIMTK